MKAIQTLSLATTLVAVLATAVLAQEESKEKSKDWPMWGGTPSRNMISDAKNVSLDFDLKTGKNVI